MYPMKWQVGSQLQLIYQNLLPTMEYILMIFRLNFFVKIRFYICKYHNIQWILRNYTYNAIIHQITIRYSYPIWTVLSIWTPLISLKVTNFIDTWRLMSVKKSSWKDSLAWKMSKSALFAILKKTCVFVVCWS